MAYNHKRIRNPSVLNLKVIFYSGNDKTFIRQHVQHFSLEAVVIMMIGKKK